MDILIVPTAGFDPRTGLPTANGIFRINTAIELIHEGKVQAIAILGGKRATGPGEADIYLRYIGKNFTNDAGKVWSVTDSSATCTNRDLLVAKEKILFLASKISPRSDIAEIKLGITSYKEHLERAAITLRYLGYQNVELVDSGEPRAYRPLMERVLTLLTQVDPTWSWFPPCLLLVWLANRRLNLTLTESSP